jgi:hypothetical protein
MPGYTISTLGPTFNAVFGGHQNTCGNLTVSGVQAGAAEGFSGPVTSIVLFLSSSSNFAAGTTATLYGMQ